MKKNDVKLKVSTTEMGTIIYQLSYKRAENLLSLLNEESFSYRNSNIVNIYAYIYNFYIIEGILLKKYSRNIVDQIMKNAYGLFIKMLSQSLDNEAINTVQAYTQNTYFTLSKVVSKKDVAGFDNILRDISKMFLNNIKIEETDFIDEIDIMNMNLIFVEWYDSDFIIDNYKIITHSLISKFVVFLISAIIGYFALTVSMYAVNYISLALDLNFYYTSMISVVLTEIVFFKTILFIYRNDIGFGLSYVINTSKTFTFISFAMVIISLILDYPILFYLVLSIVNLLVFFNSKRKLFKDVIGN